MASPLTGDALKIIQHKVYQNDRFERVAVRLKGVGKASRFSGSLKVRRVSQDLLLYLK